MHASPTLLDALSAIESGAAVGPADATLLLGAGGHELERLLDVASHRRDLGLALRGSEKTITFSKKVFIPVTTLCRDRCHYCIFVDTPGKLIQKGKSAFLTPEEILDVARHGAELGCKEALLTLGDRPEDRWPVAREWLDDHGYASTIDYVLAMGRLIVEETGLLPHFNPGVMSWLELQRLRPWAPSMGMMLETTSKKLWEERGGPHFGSPDKDPDVRLRVLEDAGRSRIPFSTGVLLGIGETIEDRSDSLFAIRESHERWGHVQETIVQNFRSKKATAMQNELDLGTQEYLAAVAVARLVMGPTAHIQAPPNLTDERELHLLIRAGIDDWGGVSPLTPDHVNPERPWPDLDRLAELTAAAGFTLRERLTAHPEYVTSPEPWIDAALMPNVIRLSDGEGMGVPGIPTSPLPQHPAPRVSRAAASGAAANTSTLGRAEANPSGLSDADYAELLAYRGPELDALTELADARRREVAPNLTFVVNRNLDASLLGDRLTVEAVQEIAEDALAEGATELCIQGVPPVGYSSADIVRLVSMPGLHIHGFPPAVILDEMRRSGRAANDVLAELRDLGLGSIPGTGGRILDDRIRSVLSGGEDSSSEEWLAVIRSAHRVGLRSTSTMMFGHIEQPLDIVAHLRAIGSLQDETGGFTEFVPMPLIDSRHSRLRVTDVADVIGMTRAVYAVSRLMLHGRIDNIQAAWPKLGLDLAEQVLRGGANDLGGLLLPGGRHSGTGVEAGLTVELEDAERIARSLGRPLRERSTLYGQVASDYRDRRTPGARVDDRVLLPLIAQ